MKQYLLMGLAAIGFVAVAEPDLSLLKKTLPDVEITSLKPSVIAGLYEVQIGSSVIYLSEDGEKIISGELYDLKHQINYSEQASNAFRKAALENIADSDKIIYKAKDEKYKITIFTDITCGYCTKLHRQMSSYNDRGITVEYLAFPRAGLDSQAREDMQNIWCSDDKAVNLTAAKVNRMLPKSSCKGNQVAEQYQLGLELGVNGTPAIFLSNGALYPGYASPKELVKVLENQFPNQ